MGKSRDKWDDVITAKKSHDQDASEGMKEGRVTGLKAVLLSHPSRKHG
jgi:hypothetical protein